MFYKHCYIKKHSDILTKNQVPLDDDTYIVINVH